jgi:hypothetical protein
VNNKEFEVERWDDLCSRAEFYRICSIATLIAVLLGLAATVRGITAQEAPTTVSSALGFTVALGMMALTVACRLAWSESVRDLTQLVSRIVVIWTGTTRTVFLLGTMDCILYKGCAAVPSRGIRRETRFIPREHRGEWARKVMFYDQQTKQLCWQHVNIVVSCERTENDHQTLFRLTQQGMEAAYRHVKDAVDRAVDDNMRNHGGVETYRELVVSIPFSPYAKATVTVLRISKVATERRRTEQASLLPALDQLEADPHL